MVYLLKNGDLPIKNIKKWVDFSMVYLLKMVYLYQYLMVMML